MLNKFFNFSKCGPILSVNSLCMCGVCLGFFFAVGWMNKTVESISFLAFCQDDLTTSQHIIAKQENRSY